MNEGVREGGREGVDERGMDGSEWVRERGRGREGVSG